MLPISLAPLHGSQHLMATNEQNKALQERLAELRRRRIAGKAENKKVAVKERRKDSKAAPQDEDVDATTKEIDDSVSERARNWDYTIDEDAKWAKRTRQKSSGSQNMNKLAELTYNREIEEMGVNKEEYEASKRLRQSENDAPVASSRHLDPEKVEKLAGKVAADSDRRYKRRRNGGENSGNYINEKNRQFNMKLERERNQLERQRAAKDRNGH